MPVPAIPSARFRRIGIELRRLREEHGLSLRSAAASLERSPSSLSLIETGLQSIRPRDLEYILVKYGIADGAFKEAMLELAREGRKTGWWRGYVGTLTPEMMDFISLEADARRTRTHQPLLIPGLCQSPGYARSLMQVGPSDEIDRGVEIRMTRQSVLSKEVPPQFDVVLGEAALRQQVGGDAVMRDQLGKLLELAELDHIDIRVIPFRAGAHRGLKGAFTVLEVGERGKLTVVTTEDLAGFTYLKRSSQIPRFTDAFDALSCLALQQPDSLALIGQIRSEL